MTILDSPPQAAKYLNAAACAARYAISVRHWLRLVDSGKAPSPARLGGSIRWSLVVLDDWDRAGNPPARRHEGHEATR